MKDSRGNPKKLWKTLSSVLCCEQSKTSIPTHGEITADSFLRAFAAKVESVRSSTASAPLPEFIRDKCASSFDQFDKISSDEARTLVLRAAEKNCALDPVPTWIIKKFIYDLAPFIAILMNTSTRSGLFPSTQKCAMVTPILKKPSLDPYDLSNYRPVSNLSFISKIMERSIQSQMDKYLEDHNLLPTKQSAYRKFHSTETALRDILSDVHTAADAGQVTLLGLLDQSSAFDVIDHCILIDRLRHTFGFSGKVHEWMISYLTDRTHYVYFNGASSNIIPLACGVPQGSVLGPQFYILYTGGIIRPLLQKCLDALGQILSRKNSHHIHTGSPIRHTWHQSQTENKKQTHASRPYRGGKCNDSANRERNISTERCPVIENNQLNKFETNVERNRKIYKTVA